MKTLTRGQKVKLAEISPQTRLQARLEMTAGALNFDLSCFGLDADGKLADDRYFVFFNQKNSPQNEIVLGNLTAKNATFELDLARLPSSVRRLVWVATVDGDGAMNALQKGRFVLSANGQDVAEFAFAGADFSTEKAVMVAEIYFKDEWRVAANGQGFKDGLNAVLKHFGGQEIEENAPAPTKTAPPSLQKVTLSKSDATFKIDLNKSAGEIVAKAQWVDNGDASDDNDDLDLRAGILWPDGQMSFVTCDNIGSVQNKPFVLHGGDVQNASKNAPGEENMRVNSQISQLCGGPVAIVFSVYSALGNGMVSIASLQPRMVLQYGAQTVECQLDLSTNRDAKRPDIYTYIIGVALIKNGQIEISPSGQLSEPGSEATPWLQWDKTGGARVTMDGPEVFKGEDSWGLSGKQYV